MKRSIIILVCTFMSICFAVAQHKRSKFNPQEFKEKLEGYITKEAGFTEGEAQVFYPIYFEMKSKQLTIQRKIFHLKKNTPTTDANSSDFANAIQKIKDLGIEKAKLEATYYKKMYEAVSPQKVYRAMCAEDKFHRQVLEHIGQGRHHAKGHRPKQTETKN